jgi:hypothetical protein
MCIAPIFMWDQTPLFSAFSRTEITLKNDQIGTAFLPGKG